MLKLREIIWELTTECNKNCAYCGSKNILNKKRPKPELMRNIAKQIADYKVEEITLSGGEPGVVAADDPETFNEILSILNDGGVKVKAVTNGMLAAGIESINYELLDVMGISVNTKEDTDYVESIAQGVPGGLGHHTMITNFGKHNIWEFDKLSACSRSFGCWQVQLTMGADYQLSADGIIFLREKLSKIVPDGDFAIVLADNLQCKHRCMAGMSSCGITHNGDVLACLSERSYGDYKSYGNLVKESLEDIWENKFKDIRFKCTRKCCRDFIEYPEEKLEIPQLPSIIIAPMNQFPPINVPNSPRIQPQVTLYGCSEPQVFAYAVYKNPSWSKGDSPNLWDNDNTDDQLMMYGVF